MHTERLLELITISYQFNSCSQSNQAYQGMNEQTNQQTRMITISSVVEDKQDIVIYWSQKFRRFVSVSVGGLP